MASWAIHNNEWRGAVRGCLHFSQVKFRFDNGFDCSHNHRHVVGETASHHGGNGHFLNGGDAMAGTHSSEHHVRIKP